MINFNKQKSIEIKKMAQKICLFTPRLCGLVG